MAVNGDTAPILSAALLEIEKALADIGQQQDDAQGMDAGAANSASQRMARQFNSKVVTPLNDAHARATGAAKDANGKPLPFLERLPLYGIPRFDGEKVIGFSTAQQDDAGAMPILYSHGEAAKVVSGQAEILKGELKAGIKSTARTSGAIGAIMRNVHKNRIAYESRERYLTDSEKISHRMGLLAMQDAYNDTVPLVGAMDALQGAQGYERLHRQVRENLVLAQDTSGNADGYSRVMGLSRAKSAYQRLASYTYDARLMEGLADGGFFPEEDVAENKRFALAAMERTYAPQFQAAQAALDSAGLGDKRIQSAMRALDSRENALAGIQSRHSEGAKLNPANLRATAAMTRDRIGAITKGLDPDSDIAAMIRQRTESLAAQFETIGGQQDFLQNANSALASGNKAYDSASRFGASLLQGSRNALGRFDAADELHRDFRRNTILGIPGLQTPTRAAMTSAMSEEKQERANALLRELVELQKDIKTLNEKAVQAERDNNPEGATAYRQQAKEGQELFDETEKKYRQSRTFSLGGIPIGGAIGSGLASVASAVALPAALLAGLGAAATAAYSMGGPAREEEIKAYNLESGLGMNRRLLDQIRPGSRISEDLVQNGLTADDIMAIVGRGGVAGMNAPDQVALATTAGKLARERGLQTDQVAGVTAAGFSANRDLGGGDLQQMLAMLNTAMADGIQRGVAASELAQAAEDVLKAARDVAGGALSSADVRTRLGIVQESASARTSAMRGANGARIQESALQGMATPVSAVAAANLERFKAEMARTGKSFAEVAAPNAGAAEQALINRAFQESSIQALRYAGIADQTTTANATGRTLQSATGGSPVMMNLALREMGMSEADAFRFQAERMAQGKIGQAIQFGGSKAGSAPIGVGAGSQQDVTGLATEAFKQQTQGAELMLAASRAMYQSTIPFVDAMQKAGLGVTQFANAATRAAININGANSVFDPTKGRQAGHVSPDLENVGADGKPIVGMPSGNVFEQVGGWIHQNLLKPLMVPTKDEMKSIMSGSPTASAPARGQSGYMARELSGRGQVKTTITSEEGKTQKVEVQVGVKTEGEIKGAKTKTITTTRVNTPPAVG